jgi:hypothetical protein
VILTPLEYIQLLANIKKMKRVSLVILSFFCAITIHAQNPADTVQISNNSVTFFRLNDAEFDSIASLPDSQGLYEADSDFGFYALTIYELYKDSLIEVDISRDRIFMFGKEVIDKFDLKNPYGVILVKDDRYKIATGIFTDVGIEQMIDDFFRNE